MVDRSFCCSISGCPIDLTRKRPKRSPFTRFCLLKATLDRGSSFRAKIRRRFDFRLKKRIASPKLPQQPLSFLALFWGQRPIAQNKPIGIRWLWRVCKINHRIIAQTQSLESIGIIADLALGAVWIIA